MNPPPGRPKEGSLPLGGTARSAQGAFSLPLDGLTIIDMTRLLPGPAATMHLVDFGADVIKVEDTGAGDYMRSFPPTVALNGGRRVNAAFEAVNRGKRSIAIDLIQ